MRHGACLRWTQAAVERPPQPALHVADQGIVHGGHQRGGQGTVHSHVVGVGGQAGAFHEEDGGVEERGAEGGDGRHAHGAAR